VLIYTGSVSAAGISNISFSFTSGSSGTYRIEFERTGNNSNCAFFIDDVKISATDGVSAYRYGFNGMEKDDEIKGSGNSYDYVNRFYDNRLGRFLSVDGLAKSYPWYTPYQFAGNNPITSIDFAGDSIFVVTTDGKIYHIDHPNAAEIKNKIGYNTLERTASGKAMLDKYKTSTTDDIYITIGNATTYLDPEGKSTQATTSGPMMIQKGSEIKYEGTNFNGIKVRNTANTSFIVFNEDMANDTPGKFPDFSTYEDAAVLFHEIKAHVDNYPTIKEKVSEAMNANSKEEDEHKLKHKISHKIYGSYNSGYRGKLINPNSPSSAKDIKNELTMLREIDEMLKPLPMQKDNTKVGGGGDSSDGIGR
jgi:RHS repeat-associated protein